MTALDVALGATYGPPRHSWQVWTAGDWLSTKLEHAKWGMLLFFCRKQAGRSAWNGNNGLHPRRRHTDFFNNSCVNRVETVPGAVGRFAEPEKWYQFGHPRTSTVVSRAGFGTRSIADRRGGFLAFRCRWDSRALQARFAEPQVARNLSGALYYAARVHNPGKSNASVYH